MRSAVSMRSVVAVRRRRNSLRGVLDDRPDQVGLVVARSCPAGPRRSRSRPMPVSIDGRGSGVSLPVGVAVELHEDEVPDLDEASAAVARETARARGRARRPPDRDRSGSPSTDRTGRSRPSARIVLLVEAEDAALGHAGDLLPELLGLVVLAEDGDVQLVLRQAVILGEQVPGELDRFGLEVVAEARSCRASRRTCGGGACSRRSRDRCACRRRGRTSAKMAARE